MVQFSVPYGCGLSLMSADCLKYPVWEKENFLILWPVVNSISCPSSLRIWFILPFPWDKIFCQLVVNAFQALVLPFLVESPCRSNPCANGGTCYLYGQGYTCFCPRGDYIQPNCLLPGKFTEHVKTIQLIGWHAIKSLW